MKNQASTLSQVTMRGPSPSERARFAVVTLSLISVGALPFYAGALGQAFSDPTQAVAALSRAVNATNQSAFVQLFGADSQWLVNTETMGGRNDLAEFSDAFNVTNRLVRNSDHRMTLEVGTNNWPFPVPLVKTSTGWCFDTAAGRDEILNRRIGRDEIEALEAVRAYVQAQREYASLDRDGDGVLEYAQKITSSPGQTDGLFWPTELNGETSPLGPLMARAQVKGYFIESSETDSSPEPFHGYFFKILKAQGKHALGGKYDYVINGNMVAGFALVAWPAEYGQSGIMTFVVNQQGRVYQKDLGPKTSNLAESMEAYDPDATWSLSKN